MLEWLKAYRKIKIPLHLIIHMDFDEFKKKIIEESKSIERYVIDTRRHIHMNPETKFEEENTAKFIEEELKKIGYETIRAAKTGVIAILNGSKEGKTIGLRADTDALDVEEKMMFHIKVKTQEKCMLVVMIHMLQCS